MEERGKAIKQIITFFVITSLLTTAVFVWMFYGAKNNNGAIFVMMWTPAISAILTSLICKSSIRTYGWKFGKARFLIYGLILPLIVSIIAYGLVWLSGYADLTTLDAFSSKVAKWFGLQIPAPFPIVFLTKILIMFLMGAIFVLGEEIGWSGFATPKLLELFSVPVTSIIVGLYWSIWHYPAIIGGFYYGQGIPLWVALPGFTLVLLGASIIRTALIHKSGSLWTGVILHTSHNVILMSVFSEMTVKKEYGAYLATETGIITGIVYVIIALLFLNNQMKKAEVQ
jgi:membrane protease YdiL (CAAX protease family)